MPLWQFFLAGALAVCAMVLPALSGSFLLVVVGMYQPVLSAVSNREYLNVLAVLLGAIVGVALFSQVLHWLLSVHYDPFMAVMVGLMVGSLRLLWPWPHGVDSAQVGAPESDVLVTVVLAVMAFLIVIVIDRMAHRLEHRGVEDEVDDLHAV